MHPEVNSNTYKQQKSFPWKRTVECNCTCVCPSFRQRQISGEVRMQQQSSLINPIALTMATVGMGVSLYSTRRMSERVHLKHADAWNYELCVAASMWVGQVKDCWRTLAKVCDGEGIREFACLCHLKENLHVPEENNESVFSLSRKAYYVFFKQFTLFTSYKPIYKSCFFELFFFFNTVTNNCILR